MSGYTVEISGGVLGMRGDRDDLFLLSFIKDHDIMDVGYIFFDDGWHLYLNDGIGLTSAEMDWLSMRMRFLEDPIEAEEELEETA